MFNFGPHNLRREVEFAQKIRKVKKKKQTKKSHENITHRTQVFKEDSDNQNQTYLVFELTSSRRKCPSACKIPNVRRWTDKQKQKKRDLLS